MFCALGFDCLQLIVMCPEIVCDYWHDFHQRIRGSHGHRVVHKAIGNCAKLWPFNVLSVWGQLFFMLVLEIEACKPLKNDLKSCRRHRNDLSV